VKSKVSKWDGGVLEFFFNYLFAGIICMITLGFGFPWALVHIIKFMVKHLEIDGQRYTFDGTGGQLLGNWIKWFLLMIVTLGIYSFWVAPRMFNWVASHLHKVEE
jgi:uncharacterized membrane protein YjgN (DUF898 family)